MEESRQEIDPEKFVIGEGHYTNQRTAKAIDSNREFILEPYPITQAFVGVFIMDMLIAFVFGGIAWLASTFLRRAMQDDLPYFLALVFLTGIATCILYSVWSMCEFVREKERGTILIYDKFTEEVKLPRHGMQFSIDEVLHLQYVTTKRLQTGTIVNNDRISELNLVTIVDGQRKRWPLLRSIAGINAFDYLVKPVLQHTTLNVVRVKDEAFGWKITETPLRLGAQKVAPKNLLALL